jgi:dienelactone hydrolase
MKRKMSYKILTVVLLILLNANYLYAQNNKSIQGIWVGDMIINENVNLQMAFEITQMPDKSISAVMHSIDQSAFDIRVEEIELEKSELTMLIKSIHAVFKGTIVSGDSISGSISQGKNNPWRLSLVKVNELPVAKPNRPQEPEKPYPYYTEDVTFQNESANVTIAGTFTRPRKMDQYPVVLLISGSGPNERDARIFGHKVFLVWADILTRAGIAVLRVDDRGVYESTGKFSTADNRDLADDVVAGVKYLKTRNDVNPNKIGLMGHSLGADIAPRAAIKSKDVDFVILMAGAAIPIDQNIHEQCRAIYPTMGASDYGVGLNERINESVFEIVKTEPDDSIARIKIAEKLASFNHEAGKLDEKDAQILDLSTPLNPESYYHWLKPNQRFDLFHNPSDYISKLTCPVLALNGSKDLQVLPHNLKKIENALIEAGNTNYIIKLFENKNHLFQTCETGAVHEYSEIEETIAPEVMDFVIGWIRKLK